MDRKKVTLLFLDLEGTIIEEENGKINPERINKLLKEILKLQKVSDTVVNIHIVSPVFMNEMENIINELNNAIVSFNIKNDVRLKEIQGAVAYPDKFNEDEPRYDIITPMKLSKGDADGGSYGKRVYVSEWIKTLTEMDILEFAIYGGNGINDVEAMKYIRKSKNGFTIAPNNSYKGAKDNAYYVSNKNETEGIAEGIAYITDMIEKRKNLNKSQEIIDN